MFSQKICPANLSLTSSSCWPSCVYSTPSTPLCSARTPSSTSLTTTIGRPLFWLAFLGRHCLLRGLCGQEHGDYVEGRHFFFDPQCVRAMQLQPQLQARYNRAWQLSSDQVLHYTTFEGSTSFVSARQRLQASWYPRFVQLYCVCARNERCAN